MQLVVERPPGRPAVVHVTLEPTDDPTSVADAVCLGENAGPGVPVWVHGSTPERDEVMRGAGYTTNRTLLQMRRPLPAPPSGLTTRPFTGGDIGAFVEVNNRAFHWHPEQGGLTAEDVKRTMSEDWFDADGFRLLELDGRLAGFCWTKIHREPEELGEIYVVALDPDYSGRGLGRSITLAGLEWLEAAGMRTAMLYVESDNAAAVTTYEGLGFGIHRQDRLWQRA